MIYKNWWKWTGFILVMYTVIAGLAIPLGPGIASITPASTRAGDTVRIQIHTVNAHFLKHPAGLQAGLLGTSIAIKPFQIRSLANNQLEAAFVIPSALIRSRGTVNLLDLEVGSDYDGMLIYRQSLEVLPDTVFLNGHKSSAIISQAKLEVHKVTPAWFNFPYRTIVYESIRNLYFHVCMWFAMITLFFVSVVYSVRYLKNGSPKDDRIAAESINVGVFFGILGLITGTIWAKFTWGDWWPNDAKLNGTLISMLLYLAYIILRNSLEEEQRRARISAVYNIFAFPMMFVLIMVLPRLTDSLHPGNGGNPGFSSYDLDSHMRFVFYPACIGWILIAVWLVTLRLRIRTIEYKIEDEI